MKKLLYFLMSSIMMLGFVSCADDNEPARTPELDMNISSSNLDVNQSMELTFTGVADQIVVYTGDTLHNYASKDDGANTGFVVSKGLFTYSYSTPGTFHVVCIASTYDTYMGKGIRTTKKEFDVTVVDNVTDIDKLYSSITPNVYYADAVNGTDWVLSLPTKQMYNSREIAVNAKKARLSFDMASDSAKIAIDGVAYSTKTYYNLTVPHDIVVTSYSGTTRNYKLYTLIYPEFSSISVAGVKGVLTRDSYYQDLQTYTFKLPKGTDVSNVVPVFSIDSDVKLYADGVEVTAGQSVDLTRTDVEYTLKRTLDGYNAVTSVSRVVLQPVFE